MAVITSAVIGTAVALNAQRENENAQQAAASSQRRANIEAAETLDRAGRESEAEILRANIEASVSSGLAAQEAADALTPFADSNAFKLAQESIISNLPVSGAIADSIRSASTDFIKSRPEFNLTSPVAAELDRQGDLAVSSASPAFDSSLQGAGQSDLAVIGDLSQIEQRGLQRLGDIAGSTGAQRASVLVGQTPELARLATGAQSARLLGDVAGQQFQSSAAGSLANLAGFTAQEIGSRSTDEFGFRSGQDPFDLNNF